MKPLSLYLHIPFCKKKCPYCSFFVLPYSQHDEERLIEALFGHIDLINEKIQSRPLISIYFGGGTPSLLSNDSIKKLQNKLMTAPFAFNDQLEVTLEANPEDVSEDKIKAWVDCGINRISLGVQSFVQKELIRLGRAPFVSAGFKAIERLVKGGITNISIDLIYEQFNQTKEDFAESLSVLKDLPITHLSLYNLLIEPHSSFYKRKEELLKQMPSDEEGKQMLELAIDKLQALGLNRYEISAFAKPGFESKHNLGYWTAREFYGLGPSAFSYIDQERFQMVKNLKKYVEALNEKKEPIDFREKLSFEAQIHELFGLELRLIKGVPLDKYVKTPELEEGIKKLIKRKWLEISDGHYVLTKEGFLFYDSVQEALL